MKVKLLTKKEKYILEQRQNIPLEKKEIITVDLEKEVFEQLKEIAKIKNITLEETIYMIILKDLLKMKKKELKEKYPNDKIIDIFDFYKLDKLIKKINKKKFFYIIATYDKPVILSPVFNKMEHKTGFEPAK